MSREVRGVAALVCVFTAVYGLIGLFRHWHFGSNYDLAIFDQAVWHLSRFEPPAKHRQWLLEYPGRSLLSHHRGIRAALLDRASS